MRTILWNGTLIELCTECGRHKGDIGPCIKPCRCPHRRKNFPEGPFNYFPSKPFDHRGF